MTQREREVIQRERRKRDTHRVREISRRGSTHTNRDD
jgi:hypothetical protein